MKKSQLRSMLAVGFLAGATLPAMANIVINPIYDSSITGNSNAVAMEADIQDYINVIESKIADPITVTIKFQDMSSGLGQSSASTIHVTYADLRAHMVTDAKSADDATALAHLPIQANDPVLNTNTGVDIVTAQARALGYTTSVSLDCTVGLNSSLCHFDHGVNHASYDYETVAAHEINESLGIGGWGSNIGFAPGIAMLDLFRYDEFGNRTFTTSGAHHAYFSLDGTTQIDEFNQFNYSTGDYSDWIQHSSNPEIQDWAGTKGPGANMSSSELRALDVSGYDLVAPVPEPASIAALGLGAVLLIRRRRK